MKCKNAREYLHRLSDGERLAQGKLYFFVGGHFLRCAACRAEWRRWKELRRLTRSLPSPSPSPNLRARVLDALPIVPPASSPALPKGRRKMALKLAGGVAVTVALTLGLLTLPRTPKSVSAAEVRQALQRVNTWHLRGWKLRDNKRVPWEVWGQRTPFFFRQQIGDEILVDDGKQRLQVFPVSLLAFTKRNLAFILASRPDAIGWSPSAKEQWRGTVKPWRETPEGFLFRFEESGRGSSRKPMSHYYVVDKQTWLPIQYELRQRDGEREQVTESFRIEYDISLTEEVKRFEIPPDCRIVNALNQPKNVPTKNIVSANGLTVEATPLAMNAEGNILVKFRGWLGDVRLNGQDSLSFQAVPAVPPPPSMRGGQPFSHPFYTNTGQHYIPILTAKGLGNVEGGDKMILFVPVEPLAPGTRLPHTLTFTLSYSPGISVLVDDRKNEIKPKLLFAEEKPLTVTLPNKATRVDPLDYRSPGYARRISAAIGPEIVEAEVAFWRANYYERTPDGRPSDRASLLKAVEWMKRAIAASKTGGVGYRMNLSWIYQRLGDLEGARRMMKDAIASAKRFPKYNYIGGMQAEMMLKNLDKRKK